MAVAASPPPPPSSCLPCLLLPMEFTWAEVHHGEFDFDGIIRECHVLRQFDDPPLTRLPKLYGAADSICGFIVCGICDFLHTNAEDDLSPQKVIGLLADVSRLAPSVERSMAWIQNDRTAYIEEFSSEFSSAADRTEYLKAWVANYEISDYLNTQVVTSERPWSFLFVRCNQYPELEVASHIERRRIIAEEAAFGLDEKYLVEFYTPGGGSPVLVAGSDTNGLRREAKARGLNLFRSAYILDLHGHFVTAIAARLPHGEREANNLILIDSLEHSDFSEHPAAVFCHQLVFMVLATESE
eukprot:NODE_3415_length_981_cov_34.399142_g3137_i0.p1 GENE.NODE_3415_length_981_cov_34.399142_g3137_i0~~NODE_3415_length_981_cov_34.399142_g3137_i0.p1  ORF type:complete len:323 (-),score=65.56 NODE_3415_length_981_cov_34.399142_g3137_i0:13-906(-)